MCGFLIPLTVQYVLDCIGDALVESSGVGGGVEGDPEALVPRLPVVESRHHFVVLKVSLDGASQDHLQKKIKQIIIPVTAAHVICEVTW